jgi:hypothetical protein
MLADRVILVRRLAISLCLAAASAVAQSSSPVSIAIDWNAPAITSRTIITLQVVANPPLRPGSSIRDNAWNSLRQLHSNDTRLALWYPYPRLAVAEILPPTPTKTFWDFSAMDPLISDFFTATHGHSTVLSITTIPQWMFKGDPTPVPANPDTPVWNYEQGAALRDPGLLEISDYYERVGRWYMKGGFRDELGVLHSSGHHYSPAYWEVFNEPEYEHQLGPEEYTRIYDAMTQRLHRVNPRLKFTGVSLAEPAKGDAFFTYFLDHSHHAPDARLDAISYHFYALGKDSETPEQQAASFFAQADRFLNTVLKIESIRRRLSPATETQINETGCIAAGDLGNAPDKMSGLGVAPTYWNVCGATFAYLAGKLTALGIQVVGASQLLGYPFQYPSVSLLDWTTGLPNPRYRVLQLLIDNLAPGDKLIGKPVDTPVLYAQPIHKKNGRRMLLLVNKTATDIQVTVDPASTNHSSAYLSREVAVDITTASEAPAVRRLESNRVVMHGFAVSFVRCRR